MDAIVSALGGRFSLINVMNTPIDRSTVREKDTLSPDSMGTINTSKFNALNVTTVSNIVTTKNVDRRFTRISIARNDLF